jgi:hypothetical protein
VAWKGLRTFAALDRVRTVVIEAAILTSEADFGGLSIGQGGNAVRLR